MPCSEIAFAHRPSGPSLPENEKAAPRDRFDMSASMGNLYDRPRAAVKPFAAGSATARGDKDPSILQLRLIVN